MIKISPEFNSLANIVRAVADCEFSGSLAGGSSLGCFRSSGCLKALAGHGVNSQFSTGGDFLNTTLEWLCAHVHVCVYVCTCACMYVYTYGNGTRDSGMVVYNGMYIVHKCLYTMYAYIVLICVCEGREGRERQRQR